MDTPADRNARDKERLKRIGSALQDGIILVDGAGTVVWMDRIAKRRLNGDVQQLALPLAKAEGATIDCFVAPARLTVNGAELTLGVIQVEEPRPSADLIAMIESVLADSTSWFTRTIVERLKAVGQPKTGGSPGNSQLDSLSAREREVLGLICEGQSDAQMATALGLSENTVRNHVAALYRKIGVKRRTAAVIWARERGITCGDDLKRGEGAVRAGARHSGNGRSGNGHSGNGHDKGGAAPY